LGAARRWSVIGREMERAGYKSRPSARIPSDLDSLLQREGLNWVLRHRPQFTTYSWK